MPRPTLLAVSHGTADAAGAGAIAALVARVASALPDVAVIEAFVDVQQPDAAELAPTIDGPLVIVPLLLSRGFHVHHDLHGIAMTRPDTIVTCFTRRSMSLRAAGWPGSATSSPWAC